MKRNAMAIYMSDSSLPIESAWSVLKGHDPDKVEKILPLIVPLALGTYGAYRGYQNITNPNGPVVTDPLTGGLVIHEQVDPTLAGYTAAGLSGLAEGVGVGAIGKVGAKAVGKVAGKRAGKIAAERKLAREAAEAATRRQLAREQAEIGYKGAFPNKPVTQATMYDEALDLATRSPYVNSMSRQAGQEAARRGAIREGFYNRVASSAGKLDDAIRLPGWKTVGALGLLGLGAGKLIYDKFGNPFPTDQSYNQINQSNQGVDFGQGMQGNDTSAGAFGAVGGQSSGFEQDYNVSNLPTANSALTERREIWKPEEGSAFESQSEYGMKQKGDLMFTYRAGDEIRKQVEELMYKGKCPACGKSPCTCDNKEKSMCKACGEMSKMCGCEKKAEDGKKPAHGMVIVIGSKATPGPSTEGKRDKLDSEKKEE